MLNSTAGLRGGFQEEVTLASSVLAGCSRGDSGSVEMKGWWREVGEASRILQAERIEQKGHWGVCGVDDNRPLNVAGL